MKFFVRLRRADLVDLLIYEFGDRLMCDDRHACELSDRLPYDTGDTFM